MTRPTRKADPRIERARERIVAAHRCLALDPEEGERRMRALLRRFERSVRDDERKQGAHRAAIELAKSCPGGASCRCPQVRAAIENRRKP